MGNLLLFPFAAKGQQIPISIPHLVIKYNLGQFWQRRIGAVKLLVLWIGPVKLDARIARMVYFSY